MIAYVAAVHAAYYAKTFNRAPLKDIPFHYRCGHSVEDAVAELLIDLA